MMQNYHLGYKSMDKATSKDKNIFFEEKTVCMKGNAAYFYNQLQQGKFSVSREFAAAVCHLPQNYTEKEYLEFIETWGTVGISVFFYFLFLKCYFISLLLQWVFVAYW